MLSDYGGSIAWGMDSLRFSVSGVATAGALGDSLGRDESELLTALRRSPLSPAAEAFVAMCVEAARLRGAPGVAPGK